MQIWFLIHVESAETFQARDFIETMQRERERERERERKNKANNTACIKEKSRILRLLFKVYEAVITIKKFIFNKVKQKNLKLKYVVKIIHPHAI